MNGSLELVHLNRSKAQFCFQLPETNFTMRKDPVMLLSEQCVSVAPEQVWCRHQQMEQDRASPIFVHHSKLARQAAGELPDNRSTHRGDHNRCWPQGSLPARSNAYPVGIKVCDAEFDAVNLTRHDFHGEWNYTISPKLRAAGALVPGRVLSVGQRTKGSCVKGGSSERKI
jgi:hypothetical protein